MRHVYVVRTAYDVRVCRTEQGAKQVAKEMTDALAPNTKFKWVETSREEIEEI